MEVRFTRHARNRMRLYELAREEIETAVAHPDAVVPGSFEGSHAWKRRTHGGWLRVTFKDEGVKRIIITVTPKRQGPGGVHAH